ncbi:MAG: efflux RND transporter periplasmic adaptor subunit [Acidobacteria bacterium]|nr:efflux RND transporter periplasmic adaptor subunit [Acidobacteriota bacterium]
MNQRNKFFVVLGVILLGSLAFYWFTSRTSPGLVLIGTVDANQVIVSSKVMGRVDKLNVDEGSQVRQGDTIAQIDSEEWRAEADAAKANIAALEARIGNAQANARLASGTTSSNVQTAQARVDAARADLLQAQADAERIQGDTDRTVSLAEQGVASRQQADEAVATLKSAQARVRSLQQALRAAESDLNSTRAQTFQAQAATSTVADMRRQLEAAKAQLAEANTRLGYTQVAAPVSGTVSVLATREGEVVNPGTPIVTLVDLSQTWVRVSIPETQADTIRLGDALTVRLPSGRTITGKVIFKGMESSFATQRDVSRRKRDIQTVALKLLVENRQSELVPGMTAEVLIPQAGARKDAQSASQAGGGHD